MKSITGFELRHSEWICSFSMTDGLPTANMPVKISPYLGKRQNQLYIDHVRGFYNVGFDIIPGTLSGGIIVFGNTDNSLKLKLVTRF